MKTSPRSRSSRSASSYASSKISPASTTSPPRRRVFSILISGVVTGITMTEGTPSRAALKATPWAWLPAEAVITPRRTSSGRREAILL